MTWQYLLKERKGLDISFWIIHVTLIIDFIFYPSEESFIFKATLVFWFLLACCYITSLYYYIRQFRARWLVGWITWSILLSPISWWITYYLSFKNLAQPLSWRDWLKALLLVAIILVSVTFIESFFYT